MGLKLKLGLREVRKSFLQIFLFFFCVVFAVSIYVGLEQLSITVSDNVDVDRKAIFGGELIISSSRPFENSLDNEILNIVSELDGVIAKSYNFPSIVFSPDTNTSLFSEIKIVSNNYPLFGELVLRNSSVYTDKNLSSNSVLKSGEVFVEALVLERLNLSIGDSFILGSRELLIKDVILSEPDRPLTLFSFGPRILVSSEDLESLELVSDKSRVRYKTMFAFSGENSLENMNMAFDRLSIYKTERLQIDTFETNESGLTGFINNFLYSLKLILLFTLILGGLGIYATINSYLVEKKQTIAIMKSLGMSSKDVFIHYFIQIFLVSLLGIVFGILISSFLLELLPKLLAVFLPEVTDLSLSLEVIIKGLILGLLLTLIFTINSIFDVIDLKPIEILKKQTRVGGISKFNIFGYFMSFLLSLTLVLLLFGVKKLAFFFLLGIVIILFLTGLITFIFLFFIRKIKFILPSLILRQAISGLFRPGNRTVVIISVMTLTIGIIFSIAFLQFNLNTQFVETYPEDYPNVFFLDIKKNQIEKFQTFFEDELTFFPVIRGGIVSVNSVLLSNLSSGREVRPDVRREFSLTYGNKVLDNEILTSYIEQDSIFVRDWSKDVLQVSVMEDIGDSLELKLGDRIIFLIQGIEVESEIVSFRKRLSNDITPFFYFTFLPKDLESAPQTIFTSLKLDDNQIGEIQNKLVKEFPQISTINVGDTISKITVILEKFSFVVTSFTVVCFIFGIIILISTLISTSFQRIKEAIFYRVIGTGKAFLVKVFLLEFVLISIISILISIIFASLLSYYVVVSILGIEFIFPKLFILQISLGVILTILTISFLTSLSIFRNENLNLISED